MGFLNLDEEPEHLKNISRSLSRRGMKPITDEEWEIHGPHQGMNFQVYAGPAMYVNIKTAVHVAIYPRAVYEIDDPLDWYKNDPDRKILVD